LEPASNTKQKSTFREYHNREGRSHGFSQEITSLDSAMKGIEAIVEQGEGANAHLVHADYRPPKLEAGKAYDPGWFRGELSHYQEFNMLRWHHKQLPEVYEEIAGANADAEQQALHETYRSFL